MSVGMKDPQWRKMSYLMIPFTIGHVWKYCFRHARLNAIKVNYLAFLFYFFLVLILENLTLYKYMTHTRGSYYIFLIGLHRMFNNFSFFAGNCIVTVKKKKKRHSLVPSFQITHSGAFVFPLDSPHKQPHEGLVLGRFWEKSALVLR